MKKLLLILAITLMVICNWNFAKAVDIECVAPNFEGSPDFYYTVGSGTTCHLVVHVCYYCNISYPGVNQNIKVLGWTFCCPPGTVVSLEDMKALVDLSVTELLENWATICGVEPCDQQPPPTYTWNLSLPVCVSLYYNKITHITEMISCTSDFNNYCSQTIKMCWDSGTLKVHWTIVEDAHLIGIPPCDIMTEEEYQNACNDFWTQIINYPEISYHIGCLYQPCKSIPCPY